MSVDLAIPFLRFVLYVAPHPTIFAFEFCFDALMLVVVSVSCNTSILLLYGTFHFLCLLSHSSP